MTIDILASNFSSSPSISAYIVAFLTINPDPRPPPSSSSINMPLELAPPLIAMAPMTRGGKTPSHTTQSNHPQAKLCMTTTTPTHSVLPRYNVQTSVKPMHPLHPPPEYRMIQTSMMILEFTRHLQLVIWPNHPPHQRLAHLATNPLHPTLRPLCPLWPPGHLPQLLHTSRSLAPLNTHHSAATFHHSLTLWNRGCNMSWMSREIH